MADKIFLRLEKEKIENKKPGETYYTQPLQSNKYHWHFTLKGVKDTCYEGGLYHGLLELPVKYPLEPPNIFFLNDSGRYQPNVKICLNITSYHKESWSPVWGVRKMMEALTAYFVCDEGGIGSLVKTPKERALIAKKARTFICPECGPLTEIEKIIESGVPAPEKEIVEVVVKKMEEPTVLEKEIGKETKAKNKKIKKK